MKTLDTRSFEQLRKRSSDALVVDVLPQESFEKEHIPGAINIPVGEENFVERVKQNAGGTDKDVIVYCASTECDASPRAAKKLEEAGFENVYDYEGGLKEWKNDSKATESARG